MSEDGQTLTDFNPDLSLSYIHPSSEYSSKEVFRCDANSVSDSNKGNLFRMKIKNVSTLLRCDLQSTLESKKEISDFINLPDTHLDELYSSVFKSFEFLFEHLGFPSDTSSEAISLDFVFFFSEFQQFCYT